MKKNNIVKCLLISFLFLGIFNSNVYAVEASDITPRIMYVNKYTYEPNTITEYNTYKRIGKVTLNNTNSSVQAYLGFEAQSSVTATLSIGLSGSIEAEVDALLSTIRTRTSFDVKQSVTVSRGTTYSTSFYVPAGMSGSITGYIPAIKTEGRMRVDKYDYTSSDNYLVSTTYKTVTTSYAPILGDVYFENDIW